MVKRIIVIIVVAIAFASCRNTYSSDTSLLGVSLPDEIPGFYMIMYNGTDYCIDIPKGSQEDGIELTLWKKNRGANQVWNIEEENGYVRFISYNKKVLVLKHDPVTDELKVVQTERDDDSDMQLWKIEKTGNTYNIYSKYNGNVLTANSTLIGYKLKVKAEADENRWSLISLGNELFTPKQMKEDVDYFLKTIENTHPNMYAYASKEAVKERVDELLKELDKPLPYKDFYAKVAQLNSLFDGHTQIFYHNGLNYRHLIDYYYAKGGSFFPRDVSYESDKIYYIDSLNKKARIISINGIPAEKICSTLNKVVSSEKEKTNALYINRLFPLYLYAFLDIQGPVFNTVLEENQEINEQGKTLNQLVRLHHPYYDRDEMYSMRVVEDTIALIEYNTCPMGADVDDFKQFIDSSFLVIKDKKIKHVFVDITRNGGGGGDEVNIFLYNKFNHKAHFWQSVKYVRRPGTEKIDTIKVLQCKDYIENQYAHNAYIIQSPLTYSAAVGVSAWFKFSKRAVIIGEETGGTTAAYVYTPTFTFPNSQIQFRVSNTLWTFPFGARLDQGILPDIPAEINFDRPHFEANDLRRFLNHP